MPTDDRRWTDTEETAGADAITRSYLRLGVLSRGIAAAVLDVVAPLIAARAAAEARVPLLSLIEDLTDDGDCWYDHNSYCQGHSLDPKPCPHERAKRVLARTHATTGEDHHA